MQFETDCVIINNSSFAGSSLVFASQFAYFIACRFAYFACNMTSATMTIISVVFLIIILAQIQSAEGAIPNLPKQKLSNECLDLMKIFNYDCPVYSEPNDSIFEQMYDNLNKICCDIYDGLEFHCQMSYSQDGTQLSKFGCLEIVAVPPGYGGQIENYDTGQPVFKVEKYDDDKFHGQRLSWQVSFNYAVNMKSKCDGLGEEILCENFEGDADRKCTCKLGFYSNDSACQRGFTDDDACSCEKMDCPKGLCPYRSFVAGNHSCREIDFSSLDFTCRPCVNSSEPRTVPITVAHENTTSVVINETLDTVSNCTKIGLSTKGIDEKTSYMYIIIIVLTSVAFLFIALFALCIWRRKLQNHSYRPVQLCKQYVQASVPGSNPAQVEDKATLFLCPS